MAEIVSLGDDLMFYSRIRAEAEAWVRAAEEQVRVADLRAETAEKWLGRIDAAAKALLLGSHGRRGPSRA